MSRLTRSWEHLKTGFQAEAASAARLKALSKKAEAEGKKGLAAALAKLSEEKAELAAQLLEPLDRQHGWEESLQALLAEERFEFEVLYPKMLGDLDSGLQEIVERVRAQHQLHLQQIEKWSEQLLEHRDDLPEGA